jgi:MoxR-like ATPase
VQCTEFPFIVITNNGERDFPPPFLRRCVRFAMPSLADTEMLKKVVRAHLSSVDVRKGPVLELINEFAARVRSGELLAVDQLLGAAFLLSNGRAPTGARRRSLLDQLLRELSSA